jgi:polyisoprenoid-binding protein YceI
MKIRAFAPALVAVAATAAFVAITSPAAPVASAAPATDAFTVDVDHAFVLFRIRHMNTGWVHGRFDEFSGTVQLDMKDLTASSVTFEVVADSVSSGNAKRDAHLKNADFLDVAQFPKISFKSTKVAKVDATHVDVTGDLTLHGTTKPVTARMEITPPKEDFMKKQRAAFDGTFTVKGAEFGLPKLQAGQDEVQLTVSVEAVKQ